MQPRRVPETCFLLLLHLLIISLVCTSSIGESSEVVEAENTDLHDANLPGIQQYSSLETTTALTSAQSVDVVADVVEAVIDRHPGNKSDVFRPSVHLGAIEEPVARTSTFFNNLQHVSFQGNRRPFITVQREQSQDVSRNVYQDMSTLMVDEATRPSRIRFQDEATGPMADHSFSDQQVSVTENTLRAPFEGFTGVGHVYVDQPFFQEAEGPAEAYDAMSMSPGMTEDDHRPNTYQESTGIPYHPVVGYYHAAQDAGSQHQDQSRPTSHAGTVLEMPIHRPAESDGGVLLVQQQESTYTRKHKFPYQFYQPTVSGEHHDVYFAEEQQRPTMAYTRTRRMSPWRKIARLIGTFLPLGLLLAALTPNVMRINNATTQPNIVLSKLRVADLPLEHKRARTLADHPPEDPCEDRSFCESILAGGEPQSDILQNILWNLATRTPDDIAKRNGLREVFSAVKKKDCTTITC